MTPRNLIASPFIFGFRTVSRVAQSAAERLEHLVGRGRSDPEARPRSRARPKALDDVSITRKVETEIFRDPDVPKGAIDVNTADGVVWIRGEAKTPEMINELERRTNEIPEVKQVENLLHLPKTPAPSRADAPRRQQKTRRSKSPQNGRRRSKSPQNGRRTKKRVTNEKVSRSRATRAEEHQQGVVETTRAEDREEQSSGAENRNPTQVELDKANAGIREQSAVRETEKSRHFP
jgi:hypothetical protein